MCLPTSRATQTALRFPIQQLAALGDWCGIGLPRMRQEWGFSCPPAASQRASAVTRSPIGSSPPEEQDGAMVLADLLGLDKTVIRRLVNLVFARTVSVPNDHEVRTDTDYLIDRDRSAARKPAKRDLDLSQLKTVNIELN